MWEGAAASFKTSLEAALEAVPSASIMVLLKVSGWVAVEGEGQVGGEGQGEGEECCMYAIVGG